MREEERDRQSLNGLQRSERRGRSTQRPLQSSRGVTSSSSFAISGRDSPRVRLRRRPPFPPLLARPRRRRRRTLSAHQSTDLIKGRRGPAFACLPLSLSPHSPSLAYLGKEEEPHARSAADGMLSTCDCGGFFRRKIAFPVLLPRLGGAGEGGSMAVGRESGDIPISTLPDIGCCAALQGASLALPPLPLNGPKGARKFTSRLSNWTLASPSRRSFSLEDLFPPSLARSLGKG